MSPKKLALKEFNEQKNPIFKVEKVRKFTQYRSVKEEYQDAAMQYIKYIL